MASIYDKALKRKDFSGVTSKDKQEEVATNDSKSKFFRETFTFLSIHTLVDKTEAQKQEERDKAARADDYKAGVHLGKIVNLMAVDANRVQVIVCFTPFLSSNATS